MNDLKDKCQSKVGSDPLPTEIESTGVQSSLVGHPRDSVIEHNFRKLWHKVTDDNYFALFGFRRFRTAHLLNLRLLENEIDGLDRKMYQAGIKLGAIPTSGKRLGLAKARKDADAPNADEVMKEESVLKMRRLLEEYGTFGQNSKRKLSMADAFPVKTQVSPPLTG
ncbi:MAG: hypothetical protein Q9214_007245 [Letrouitia sp. 1 TL-2023]